MPTSGLLHKKKRLKVRATPHKRTITTQSLCHPFSFIATLLVLVVYHKDYQMKIDLLHLNVKLNYPLNYNKVKMHLTLHN